MNDNQQQIEGHPISGNPYEGLGDDLIKWLNNELDRLYPYVYGHGDQYDGAENDAIGQKRLLFIKGFVACFYKTQPVHSPPPSPVRLPDGSPVGPASAILQHWLGKLYDGFNMKMFGAYEHRMLAFINGLVKDLEQLDRRPPSPVADRVDIWEWIESTTHEGTYSGDAMRKLFNKIYNGE